MVFLFIFYTSIFYFNFFKYLHLDIASFNDKIKIDKDAALNLNVSSFASVLNSLQEKEAPLEILKEKMDLVDNKLAVFFKQLLNFLNSLTSVLDAKL